MNLLLSDLPILVAVFTLFATEAETNIAACSPENTNIEIDATVPGVISTPEFPDGHPRSSCTWKIKASDNFRLEITIKILRLKGVDDYIVIRDGPSQVSPQIGKYGPCASGSVTLFSSGSSAFLQGELGVFNSNEQIRISYRPTDPDDIDCSNQAENPPNFCSDSTELREPSGVLSSPNFPNNYEEGENCLWTIIAPQGYRVQFIIHWLGIEDHRYSRPGTCGDDNVVVTEDRGTEVGANVVKLCGCQRLFKHVSFNKKMWVSFSSYKKANWPGFYATYQVLAPDECPAGDNDCPEKRMAPVGFNAQGQVCTALVKTSSRVRTSSSTPSLLPSSVESLAKTSSQALDESKPVAAPSATPLLLPSSLESLAKTSSQMLEKATQVTELASATPSFVSASMESLAKTSSQMLEKSTQVTAPASATPSLLSTSVESLAKTSSQMLEKSTQVTAPASATPSLLSTSVHVESLAKTSSQMLENSIQVTEPASATPSLLSTSVESLAKTSSQMLEKGTQVTELASGTSSVVPSTGFHALETGSRVLTLEKRTPVTSTTPFVAGSSPGTGRQTDDLRTPVPSLSATTFLETGPSAKKSRQTVESTTLVPSLLATPSLGTVSSANKSRQTMDLRTPGPPLSVTSVLEMGSSSSKSRQTQESRTPVSSPSDRTGSPATTYLSTFDSSVFHSVIFSPSKTKAASAEVAMSKKTNTQEVIPSSIVISTFTALYSSEVESYASSLRPSDRITATSSVKWRQSREDVPGFSTGRITDRETIDAGAQLKRSRNTSMSRMTSVQTEALKPNVSADKKFYQNKTFATGATRAKESSTTASLKWDIIKPSISTIPFPKDTLTVAESKILVTPTATKIKPVVPKASVSVSTKPYQQDSLVVTSTEPIGTTSSLARKDQVISQSFHVIPVSHSKRIKPSRAGEKASKVISSGVQTTPVKEVSTTEASVTIQEPHDNKTAATEEGPPKGVAVKCTYYAMEIIISRTLQPSLVISSLHLQDPTCKVLFANDTHALLRAPLESCDTEQTISEDYFIYINTMMGDTRSSSSSPLITRKGRVNFKFQCSYRKIHVISIVSYSPRRKVVRTSDGDGIGNFTFEMDMFKDPKFDIVVNQYPVNVFPGQTMYFQVNVKSRDRSLVAFLEECWVTPTTNPRDKTRYTIIEHGCSRDSTLQYLYEKSSIQKFTFKAFKFRHVTHSQLYVHCEVVTCRSSDTGSVCDTGCTENRRRRRENKPYIMDKDVFLSLGPVNFQEKSAAESSASIVYIQALTGVLGVLALILLIAMVILILRRRKQGKNSWILLAAKAQRVEEEKQASAKLMTQTEL